MRGAKAVLFASLLTFARLSLAGSAGGTLPVPAVGEQADAWKTIHEIYKEQYGKKGVSDEINLSQTLLDQTNQTHDDPVSRYVMLRESRDLAAAAGDINQAMKAAAQIQADYQVDPFDVKMPALKMVATHVQGSDRASDVINACRSMAEQAFDAHRLDVVQSCSNLAGFAADRVTDSGVLIGARHLQRWIALALVEAPRAQAAEKDLTSNPSVNPNDPDRNLIVGKYYALTRDDFGKGLVFLSRSSDAEMKALALAELGQSPDPDEIVRIGDGWWELGEKSQDWQKIYLHSHAAQLYLSVVDRLSGITAARTKSRIAGTQQESTDVRPTALDFVRSVAPEAGSVSGNWTTDGAALRTSGQGYEIFCFGYQPPDEYDVECDFIRLTGDQDINLVLAAHGRSFLLKMGAWRNTVYGVDMIGGVGASDLADATRGRALIPPNQQMRVLVKVRKGEFTAVLNGKYTYHTMTDYSNWAVAPDWDKAPAGMLGVGALNSSVIFQSFKLSEISGRGKTVARLGN